MGMVFISYNRGSLDEVKGLAQDLTAAGCQPWFDQELTGGQRWWDSILARIRECHAFVFALTPDALDSRACGRELDYAVALGKPVLPVLLSDQVDTRHLRAAIGEIQYVDYRRQDKIAAFSLMRALAALPAPPPLPDPLPSAPAVPISYIVSLKERIDHESPLDFQDQIALVIELRDRYREGRPIDEITELLDRLKKRDDLLAKVGREIDAVIAEIAQGRAAMPAPEPGAAPSQRRDRSGRKEAAGVPEPAKARVPEPAKQTGPEAAKQTVSGAAKQSVPEAAKQTAATPRMRQELEHIFEVPEAAKATAPTPPRKDDGAQGQDEARGKSMERIKRLLRLDEAAEECERVMRRVVVRNESWVFEIDAQNCFTLALDTSEAGRRGPGLSPSSPPCR